MATRLTTYKLLSFFKSREENGTLVGSCHGVKVCGNSVANSITWLQFTNYIIFVYFDNTLSIIFSSICTTFVRYFRSFNRSAEVPQNIISPLLAKYIYNIASKCKFCKCTKLPSGLFFQGKSAVLLKLRQILPIIFLVDWEGMGGGGILSVV